MSELPTKTIRYQVDITPRSFLVLALGALAVFSLWSIKKFLLLIILAVIVASFVNAGVRLLKRIKIPRALGVTIMYLFFIGIVVLIVLIFLPLLFRELAGLIDYLPKNTPWGKLLNRVADNGLTESTFRSVLGTSNVFQGIQNFWKIYLTDPVLSGINRAIHVVGDVLLVFIMSFFLSIREGALHGFFRAITPVRYESYVIDLWDRVEEKIGYWFGGQFILAIMAGIVAFAGFAIIGMPYALLLSLFVLLLEFIPFGLTVGTITIAPMAFVMGGPTLGIPILIFLLVLNFLESNIFQPLIVHKTVGVPMLLVIIAVIAWIQLIGWVGAIIAIPFAVLVLEIIYDREKISLSQGKDAFSE